MRVEIFSRAIRSDKSRWGERERGEKNSWRSSGGGTKESSIVRSKRLLREKRSLVGLEEREDFSRGWSRAKFGAGTMERARHAAKGTVAGEGRRLLEFA